MSVAISWANKMWLLAGPASEVALYINKSHCMALSAGANITGLNHTLQAANPKEST